MRRPSLMTILRYQAECAEGRYGELIVIVTLQGYEGTNQNKAKVTELIRMQAAGAKRAL
jgi:hypothetical protein